MSGLRQRVIAGAGANSVGMAVSVATQLAALPLFLAQWDATTYGIWLMLSAVPTYLAMADVGMVTAAGNHMTMALGARRNAEAQEVFQSAQAFVLSVVALLLAVLAPLVLWAPWPRGGGGDERMALLLLCLGVCLAFAGGLCDQRFRATQRYALGTLLGHGVRLAEWTGWIVGLVWVGSFTAVALGGLLARVLGTLLAMRLAAHPEDPLRWGLAAARWSRVRALVRPALGFMAFPVANALSLQGITLLVGALLGPAAVAVFNTYRTLARTVVQVSGLFSHALWPEFSRLRGQGDGQRLARLARMGLLATGAQALVLGTALYLLAPPLLRWWTHGEIPWQSAPFAWLMAYGVLGAAGHVPRILLMASNQHGALALWTLGSAALGMALCTALAPHGLSGVALGMAIAEAAIAAVALALAWPWVGARWTARELTP